jgi:hypothetical protein
MPRKTPPTRSPDAPSRSAETIFAVHWAAFRRDLLDNSPQPPAPEALAAFEATARLFYFHGRTDELQANLRVMEAAADLAFTKQ